MCATRTDRTRRLDVDRLRGQVEAWFTRESLEAILGAGEGHAESIAREWLAGSGKRWRPFLAVCAAEALGEDAGEGTVSDHLRNVAVAVECFHKASLVHDDIEDRDRLRYGKQTLHARHGVPIALNVGDLLVGQGYRLIARCRAGAEKIAEMLRVAADGHRRLCIGQGAELHWVRRGSPLSVGQVIDIFRRKTAPAFEVALQFGAIHAGADAGVREVLTEYSEALGIAYQIRDDLNDFFPAGRPGDPAAMRPSLLLALACERASGPDRKLLEAVWTGSVPFETIAGEVQKLFDRLEVESAARQMLSGYKGRTVAALGGLDNVTLKGLLRRVVARIFNDIETAESDHGHEASDASDRPVGTEQTS